MFWKTKSFIKASILEKPRKYCLADRGTTKVNNISENREKAM